MTTALSFAFFFVCWRLTRLHVYNLLLLGSQQGVLTAYLEKGKKDLTQNNPVLFFSTFNAKVKTVVLLRYKDFANMFGSRVRKCIGQRRGLRESQYLYMQRGLKFCGTWVPEGFGSLIINYT